MKIKSIAGLTLLFALTGCATLDLDTVQYDGSGRLRIAFLQGGKSVAQASADEVTRVELANDRFAMLIPTTERPIRICASNSPVIFVTNKLSTPTCFAPNTAVERQKNGPLLLSISDKHSYYPLANTDNGKRYRAIHISGYEGVASNDIYVTVFIDINGNGAFDRKESENFILSLPQSGDKPARTNEEIATVFAIHKNKIHREYKRALRKNPALSGKLDLKLTIQPSGKVSRVTVASSTLKYAVFERKILTIVDDFNFGPKSVPAVTISYPLDLADYAESGKEADKDTD